jgi:hypothetical protein
MADTAGWGKDCQLMDATILLEANAEEWNKILPLSGMLLHFFAHSLNRLG